MKEIQMKSITEKQFYKQMEQFISECDDFDLDFDNVAFCTDKEAAMYYLDRFAEKIFPKYEWEKKRIAELEKEIETLKSKIKE